MATSCCMNIHLPNLFVYYTLDSQVFLSSYMSINADLFFILIFCCIIIPMSGIIDNYCIMENLQNSVENKNKLITIYPKNHENLKSSKPRVNVTGSYRKRVYLCWNNKRFSNLWTILATENRESPKRILVMHAFLKSQILKRILLLLERLRQFYMIIWIKWVPGNSNASFEDSIFVAVFF